jgi:hypothetical protein
MKEGLLGGTLNVSPRSELEEARLHVARWAGPESKEDRRLFAVEQRHEARRAGAGRGITGGAATTPARVLLENIARNRRRCIFVICFEASQTAVSRAFLSAGGGTRTPDTRIMIPLL